MSYRIVRVTILYPDYLANYYSKHPTVADESFEKQYQHLLSDSVDIVASITRNLRDLGVEAFALFTNATPLQNRWKLENKCDKLGNELVFEQIKTLQPDIVWLDDTSLFDRKWISYVRENVPSVKIVTGHMCSPYNSNNLKNLQALDFLTTCTPCLRDEFEDNGIKTYLVYHAFEKQILDRVNTHDPRVNDLVFTGSLLTGGGFHKTRIEYLDHMLDSDIKLKVYGSIEPNSKILTKIAAYYFISMMRAMKLDKMVARLPVIKNYEIYGDAKVKFYSAKMRASLLPPVFGIDQFELLANSKICFNIHGEIAKGCAGNVRLFEATGLGTCLITDWKANLKDLFEPEAEVVTYRSKEECVEKMTWLLQNPVEMKKISLAGHDRTLKDHTTDKRALLINELLKSKL